MPWLLGFLTAIAFVPEISGGANFPRYAIPALFIPFLIWNKKIPFTLGHFLGLGAFLGAALTIQPESLMLLAAWKLAFLAMVFIYGSTLNDLKPIGLGMAWGVAISGVLVWFQKFGYSPVGQVIPPSGLFMNKNLLAEAAVIASIFALWHKRYVLALFTLCAAVIPMSRGAWLGLAIVALVWIWNRNRTAAVILSLGAVTALFAGLAFGYRLETVDHRMAIWADAAQNLKWFGNGWGSFYVQFPSTAELTNVLFQRPEHAHNDFLELIYDLGLISVPFFLLFGYILIQAEELERLIILSVLVMGAFGFPLYAPFTGFALALVAGRVARRGRPCSDLLGDWGSLLHQRLSLFHNRRGGNA